MSEIKLFFIQEQLHMETQVVIPHLETVHYLILMEDNIIPPLDLMRCLMLVEDKIILPLDEMH